MRSADPATADESWTRALGTLAGVLQPERCPLCPAADAGDGLGCAEHRLVPALAGPRCGRCARALSCALPDGHVCAPCRRDPPAFECAVALVDYAADDATRAWILALKHGGRADLARSFGPLLAARWGIYTRQSGAAAGRVLVPIPLHPLRRLERGYDQAGLLARHVSESSGVHVARALRRVRHTTPQGAPGSVSRRANVDAAFAPRWPPAWSARAVRGRDAWLVDDVLTSGATASECARVLKRLGAARVSVLALARA